MKLPAVLLLGVMTATLLVEQENGNAAGEENAVVAVDAAQDDNEIVPAA
jgi:hypothetical protein